MEQNSTMKFVRRNEIASNRMDVRLEIALNLNHDNSDYCLLSPKILWKTSIDSKISPFNSKCS